MNRRGASIASAAAFALIALVGAQSSAAVTHDESKSDFAAKISTTLSAYDGTHYAGKIKAESPCRSDRKVQVRSAADNSVLATDQTDDQGKWSAATTFAGPVYFKVTKKFVQIESDESTDNPKTDKDDFVFCKRSIVGGATSADLALIKTFISANCDGPCDETYSFIVQNAGPDPAVNTIVTELLPTGWAYNSSSIPCTDNGNGTVSCALGTLAPGQVAQFTIRFTMASGVSCATNTARVASNTPDPNPANNESSDSRPC